jgi:putative transcriptional regulator
MSKERIVRVTREEAKNLPRSDWERVEAMTEEERHQNALADPDNPPWPEAMLARARRVPNVQAIRTRLGMTQEEFAKAFEISLYSIRDWEQGRSRPDSSAQTLLRIIERRPDMVREALAS